MVIDLAKNKQLEAALASAENDEEVILIAPGGARFKLIPVRQCSRARFGSEKGNLTLSEDFDQPLPELAPYTR